jgi:hypothetical protein
MAFFDKKEEVLDLVLTRRGRELLAEGKLKPTYYDFFDDGIIYDYKYAASGSAEAQNDIVPRIRDSVTVKNQNGWHEVVNVSANRRKIPLLFKSLARSSQFDENKPAWELNVAEGQVIGAVGETPLEYSNGKLQTYMEDHIPQVEVVCEYSSSNVRNPLVDPDSHQMWLSRTSDDLLINLEEHNVEDSEDNFTLEVFRYVYADVSGSEKIVDIEPMKFSEEEHDQEIVEYFFNLLADSDINEELTIKYVDVSERDSSEKQFDSGDDKCATDKSCAKEKIEKLKKEIAKLKKEKEQQKFELANTEPLNNFELDLACTTIRSRNYLSDATAARIKANPMQHKYLYDNPKCKRLTKEELIKVAKSDHGKKCSTDVECTGGRCRQGKCETWKETIKFKLKELGEKCIHNEECKGNEEGSAGCLEGACTKLDKSKLKEFSSVDLGDKCSADAECGYAYADDTKPETYGKKCEASEYGKSGTFCYKLRCVSGKCYLPKG